VSGLTGFFTGLMKGKSTHPIKETSANLQVSELEAVYSGY
jgi:hypothetical protein